MANIYFSHYLLTGNQKYANKSGKVLVFFFTDSVSFSENCNSRRPPAHLLHVLSFVFIAQSLSRVR